MGLKKAENQVKILLAETILSIQSFFPSITHKKYVKFGVVIVRI